VVSFKVNEKRDPPVPGQEGDPFFHFIRGQRAVRKEKGIRHPAGGLGCGYALLASIYSPIREREAQDADDRYKSPIGVLKSKTASRLLWRAAGWPTAYPSPGFILLLIAGGSVFCSSISSQMILPRRELAPATTAM